MSLKDKIIFIFIISGIFLIYPSTVTACTYEATITGNHVDFSITSDFDKLAVIQYINSTNFAVITKMYPPNTGQSWTSFDDPYCNVNLSTPIMCRQDRTGSSLGDGAFWQWYSEGDYHIMPGGVYGLDFNVPPTYDLFRVGYGTKKPDQKWIYCDLTGNISTPTPTPVFTITPLPTPIQTPTSSPLSTSTPTPTPTFTLSPSSTPSPTSSPTPANISKVFFVPGLGASWNLDAFATCKLNNYSGSWSLAPYAENIYLDILSTLSSSGWDTKPFYYDWRKNVTDNAQILSDFISNNSSTNEKVDLVGHSMGGLVGRSYLESNQGGKLAKYLSVGTPHQGSSMAYAPWSGGEIWRNNLIEEISLDLYLKHCGGIFSKNRQTIQSQFSSIQNLLPTYDYIRDFYSKSLKPAVSMKAKNNYLPTNFASQFWNVKVGTLSGTGFPTLSQIVVVNPSKTDISLGNWFDGKPINKEYSNNGDGTVLSSSSQIDGAINMTINQTHSGLVGTTEGINKILNFLGSPGVGDPPFFEPKSALILVGYPGNFYLTDKNGKTSTSKNGMIAIINPKDGDYQLQITPTSQNSTFIVGQFLANGQTLYKEYKLKGMVQTPKIIKFSSTHPTENILHEATDYKNPKLPKFPKLPNSWFSFWNWWKKF